MRLSSELVGNPSHFLAEQLQRVPLGRPWWLTLSLPWPDVSFLAVLKHASDCPRSYWESSLHPVSLAGWGKVIELTDWGERRFQGIQDQAKHLAAQLFPLNPQAPVEAGPRWIGSFSFLPRPPASENDHGQAIWQAFPDAYFVMHRFQLARLADHVWLTISHLVEGDQEAGELESLFNAYLAEAEALYVSAVSDVSTSDCPPVTIKTTLSEPTWKGMVTGALHHIRKTDFKKVVLARTLQAEFSRSPEIAVILQNLRERYPDCFRFMIEPEAGRVFLGATPELLAEVQAPAFRTAALAGTTRRGSTPAEDDRLARDLLDNPKERQEHAIVIQAIESKLASLAVELEIAPEPELRKLGNLQHLQTPIHGRLAYSRGVLDLVAALHPTPALGGWPQAPAQDYLASAEPFTRGWYGAPVGWFDPLGNGLFAVGIRSGLFIDRTATLFAGAGIVADSDPIREWQETGLKFIPLLEAIGGQVSDE